MTNPGAGTDPGASDDRTPILAAERLGFSFDGAPAPLFASLDLSVPRGEIVAILGRSGCGKSTLLKVLAGLLKPGSGVVRFAGDVQRAPHARAALLFQQPSLLPWLTLAGNVGFGLAFKRQPALGADTRRQRIADAIRAVGLEGFERHRPSQLSGGMAQRVAIARALAREPVLLLADEPFSALDPLLRAEMQQLLSSVARQRESAVVIVTHDVDEAIVLADRVLLLGAPEADPAARLLREWRIAGRGSVRDAGDPRRQALRADILSAFEPLAGASTIDAAPAWH